MSWSNTTNHCYERDSDGLTIVPFCAECGKEIESSETPRSNVIWHVKTCASDEKYKGVIYAGKDEFGEWDDVNYIENVCNYIDQKYALE